MGKTLLIRKKTTIRIRECVPGSAHQGTNFTKLEFQCHEFKGLQRISIGILRCILFLIENFELEEKTQKINK